MNRIAEFIKIHKTEIITWIVVALVLGTVFVLEGRNSPEPETVVKISATEAPAELEPTEEPIITSPLPSPMTEASIEPTQVPDIEAIQVPLEEEGTVPENSEVIENEESENETLYYTGGSSDKVIETPQPTEAPAVQEDNSQKCTISIYCTTLLQNMNRLEKEKHELVPSDGCILSPVMLEFEEGDTVFDILQKVTRENKIHMEHVNTPIYKSAYIEGINNLYEFDCGELSGWMYSVNGEFPNYGCSGYKVKSGDVIVWHYTCDLGRDVSGRVISQKDK